MVQGGMEVSQVLSVYSIATVGDGLVAQIPALMISTSAGMIVTSRFGRQPEPGC